MKKYILLILIISISCASVPYEKTAIGKLEPLIGSSFKRIILDFGPPTNIYTIETVGRIFSYEYSETYIRPSYSYSYSISSLTLSDYGWNEVKGEFEESTFTTPPQEITNKYVMQFYVNQKGKIYHIRTNMKSDEEIQHEQKKQTRSVFLALIGVSATLLVLESLSPNN